MFSWIQFPAASFTTPLPALLRNHLHFILLPWQGTWTLPFGELSRDPDWDLNWWQPLTGTYSHCNLTDQGVHLQTGISHKAPWPCIGLCSQGWPLWGVYHVCVMLNTLTSHQNICWWRTVRISQATWAPWMINLCKWSLLTPGLSCPCQAKGCCFEIATLGVASCPASSLFEGN